MDEIQKATINIINKNDNKCFNNAATFALDHKDIRTNSENIPHKKMIEKNIGKIF